MKTSSTRRKLIVSSFPDLSEEQLRRSTALKESLQDLKERLQFQLRCAKQGAREENRLFHDDRGSYVALSKASIQQSFERIGNRPAAAYNLKKPNPGAASRPLKTIPELNI